MNIDRLIDRIEKVLREGATDPVFHSLAKEYARYRTIIDQRLDQCVTLIRSGKKFSALELAEESPNALDLMERLSFAGDAKWKELCEEKNIYLGPNFTEDHVDMLEGLYGEQISEDHPVFREYRTAMRSRDETRTFKILKTILRMNPDHEAAQRHFGQLSVKILEQNLNHLDLLIREGRKDELLALMDEVETTDWVIPPEKSTKVNLWENALAVRQTYRKADAKVRCEGILVDLAQYRASEQWTEALSLIGEFYELSQEHGLENEHESDDINAYNDFREWAEERMEEDRDARALQTLVARFKNRITEMKQAESAGGLTVENYLEFQAEINGFRKEFEDMGRSDVPPETLLDLQKSAGWAKNRVAKLRSRTKKIWLATAFLTVAAIGGFLVWFTFSQERSDLLDSVAEVEKLGDPFKQWNFLETFGNDEVQQKYLENKDEDLQNGLNSVTEKTFINACSLDAGRKEAFLVATEGKTLPFAHETTLQQGRSDVLVKLCEDMLATNPPNLKSMWNFVERFTNKDIEKGVRHRKTLRDRVEALRPSYNEIMKGVDRNLRSNVTRAHLQFAKERQEDLDELRLILTELRDLNQPPRVAGWEALFAQEGNLPLEFPYYAYANHAQISPILDQIDQKIESIEEKTALTQDQFDDLLGDLSKLRGQIQDAGKKFKTEGSVNKFLLSQGTFIEEMGSRYEKIKAQLSASETLEISKALRDVRTLWNTYKHLVRESAKKKIEGLLVAGEKLAASLDSGHSTDAKADLSQLAEAIKKLVAFRGNQDDAFKPSFVQDRRINKLVETQGRILAKMGQGTQVRGEVIEASDLESYLAALERARQVKAYQGAALQAVQQVTANRNLFANDRGQLQRKLLFDGPEEVWGKIKTGELGVHPENSQREYEDLSVIVNVSGIRDMWRYEINKCTPVAVGTTKTGQNKYNTKRELTHHIYSFGKIEETAIEEKFDENGDPVELPLSKIIQQGQFLIEGQRKGMLFDKTTKWGGGIDSVAYLEEPQLMPESKFVLEQIGRRLNGEKRRVLTPLIDLLDVLVMDQTLSTLFKAYMHDKLCEIMFHRAEEWGVPLSSSLRKDHEKLKDIMKLPLKITDWMNPASYEAMQGSLGLFYRGLASRRRYGEEVKFNASFLRQLSSASFPFAGYVDDLGQPRYLNSSNPPDLTWCMGHDRAEISLQRFTGSNALPYSPLLTIDKDWKSLVRKALTDAGAKSLNNIKSIDDLMPFRYSEKQKP